MGAGHWRCQGCGSDQVTDQQLGIVTECVVLHRLICQGCGEVSHYNLVGDRFPEDVYGRFSWVSSEGDR